MTFSKMAGGWGVQTFMARLVALFVENLTEDDGTVSLN